MLLLMMNRAKLHYLLSVVVALFCIALINQKQLFASATNEQELKRIVQNEEFNDEQLGSAIKDFGKQMSGMIANEMDKLLSDVQQSSDINAQEFSKFKEANEALTRDTQVRVEQAGETSNSGEITRGWATNVGQSFVNKANSQIQTASNFLDHQMTMLSNLAPKVRSQLSAVPGKLLRFMQWPTFLTFKMLYKKAYKSAREELYRQIIYLNNQAACGVQNIKFVLGKTTHLLKATQFADLSAAEYRESYNNPEAANEDVEALFTGGSGKLDAAKRSQLEHLAKEHQNVFGQSIDRVLERSTSKHNRVVGIKQLRRRRRSLVIITGDELDEKEEGESGSDDESDEFEDALDHFDENNDDKEEVEALRLLDLYASQNFKPSQVNMDDIDDIANQALDEEHKSKPIDLRATGCVIKPENQDVCGCCYAHVTTAAAAYYNCMQSSAPKPPRYNARFVSDCGRYLNAEGEVPYLKGCTSGKVSMAIKFARIAGVYTFPSYELARLKVYSTDNCAFSRPETIESWAPVEVPFYKESQFTILRQLDEVDLHLRTVGPVWLNILTWKDFHLQGAGIVEKMEIDDQSALLHSMLIVGHDRDANGRDYWIIWNSHGIAWGEDGFIRVYSDALLHYKRFMSGLLPSKLS